MRKGGPGLDGLDLSGISAHEDSPSRYSSTPRLPKPTTKRRKPRSFLERCLIEIQRPEVVLYSIWWLVILVLTVYLADLAAHLRTVWRPLLLLGSIPVLFGLAICIVSM
mmetsp:Transcript_29133/g.67043  ORF Transcript_29133/g.67043 Transcript_29133/m.67043 type:complete len:109 (-) Transcript_29133:77-403(-)